MRYIIVAYDKNRVIGGNNQLLWQGEMPADMKRFRRLTMGGSIIMGRKTYESIGQALPGRQNIVISRQDLKIKDVTVVGSLAQAYAVAEAGRDVYVIGGGQIFAQTLESVDEILATEIDASFDGDVYFTELSSEWREKCRENFSADSENKYNYSFVTYSKL